MSEPGWVVVTGASSGIGRDMARIAVARGRPVAIVARRGERLEELRAELAPSGIRVETIVLDLEPPEAADALMATLAERGIVPDTLVNNAGFGLRGRFATMPYREQIAMVELNVVTLTRLCRLVLPGMIERGRGGIINLSSVAAFPPIPYLAVYAATKAYVQALSEGLHEEVRRHGIVVTAVCPGSTATEFAARADLERSKAFRLSSMSSEVVARQAWDGHEAGRAVVVTGGINKFAVLFCRLLPRGLIRRAAGAMQG